VNENYEVVTSQTALLEEIKQLRVSVDSLPDRITTSMVKAAGRENPLLTLRACHAVTSLSARVQSVNYIIAKRFPISPSNCVLSLRPRKVAMLSGLTV
jgi:hypothetical protein